MTLSSIALVLFVWMTLPMAAQIVVLESKAAKVVIELAGGAISDFHLAGQDLNPLRWELGSDKLTPRLKGHFLCLDRWGAPSEAELKNGMPFHGEAPRMLWQSRAQPRATTGAKEAEMAASLPMAGLDVTRRIRFSQDAAFFTVTETVTNRNKLGRIYNMVQHPTIGPPFLDERTLVDSNAGRGFMQNSPLPNPEQPSVNWPEALEKDKKVDLRRLVNDPAPDVVSYIMEDRYGWTTASSPSSGLLIGYIWRTSDYPLFNVWRDVQNGRPSARGLEFGTTGLHQPFAVLTQKGRIFDRPLFSHLDAGEAVARQYACFLLKVPNDYKGVAKITYSGGQLRLREHGGAPGRELTMTVGNLFSE